MLLDFARSDRNVWPTRTSGMVAAEFAQSMVAHSYCPGADWWKDTERKETERRAEAERVAAHHAEATSGGTALHGERHVCLPKRIRATWW